MPAKKNRRSGLAFLLVIVALVVIGLLIMHGHKNKSSEKTGFATSETASGNEPLGSFADFNVTEAPIIYDGSTVTEYVAPTDAGETPALPAQTTSAGSTTNPTATTEKSSAATEKMAVGSTITGPTTAAGSTTNGASSTVGSTVHSFSEGADYAYAYAGFTPKQANMNTQWNLLLVNRNYILPQDYSPDLSEAVKGSGVRMDSRVSPHYQEMYDAAKKDGITLTPLSGHRRISTQKTNFENKIQKYVNQGYDRAEATRMAAKIILPPGTSEHNAGLAMDIISLDVEFEETKAFAWLQEHAQDYGFILRYPKSKESITEITYEPWHWRYVGVPAAKAIKQSGQTLEEYLGVR